MANIDTLQAFEDLVSAGTSEKEAKAQVHLLNNSLDGSVTKEDLRAGLEMLEKDLKYFFINSFIGFIYAPLLVGLVIWGISWVIAR